MTELVWRKSSRSGSSTNCVEVARATEMIALRDSKDPEGGQLRVGESQWGAFLKGLKNGRFRCAE
ncbi:DUF397 domain-containing protein [Saccharopolyspora karakumensis]|uniref:DUF397 domain-containing protein n=1 Tax=Saccharopolyspora karakumensis TaxID=2530386 RepID=A0A4R5C3E6_9PSEU|nr:DUF397 domain-containing protein [Saccharopolyspora karakumensis]TDD91312.1 DUF397 domain-containing protein [Saccharopolyspora karakumensis]